VIDLDWAHPERVHLLWAVLALVGVLAWLELRSHDLLGRFVSQVMAGRLAERLPRGARMARLGLIGLCLVAGVLALMQPRSRGATETLAPALTSADVMVVLDVSKSMLAEDAAPNRLDRARTEIGELVAAMSRHRFGLIAFAGRAAFLTPLTTDHAYFRMVLGGVGPDSVTRGGTRIGEALNAAVDAFGPGSGARLIVLITDGEDHGSMPLEAAEKARLAGIPVITIGFGDEKGSPIVLTDPKTGARRELRADGGKGEVVISRLDGALLRQIAEKTGGAYVPAGTSGLDLESIVAEHIEPIARAGAPPAGRQVPAERYPVFVLVALLALLGATAVGVAARAEVVHE
jgi:Ca-activated chloride channel family protein